MFLTTPLEHFAFGERLERVLLFSAFSSSSSALRERTMRRLLVDLMTRMELVRAARRVARAHVDLRSGRNAHADVDGKPPLMLDDAADDDLALDGPSRPRPRSSSSRLFRATARQPSRSSVLEQHVDDIAGLDGHRAGLVEEPPRR